VIVDVHGHITPPELLERLPMPKSLGDVEGMIEQKLEAGIDLSIVGSPVGVGTMVPVPGLDNFDQPLDGLQRFHDWLAGKVAEHPDHLRAYAWTNPFGDDGLLEQTASTVRDGGFVGLIVNSSVRGEYLDSPRADRFFALAAELDVPILLHPPAEPAGGSGIQDFRLVEQVGRVCDVTVSLATLAFSRRLEDHPNLKIIGAMAGGAIALLPSRLDIAKRSALARPGGPALEEGNADPGTAAASFYVDTATYSAENLEANLQVVGPERMLFGSDSPPAARTLEEAIALVERLPVPEEARRRIYSENAKALFRLDGSAARHARRDGSEGFTGRPGDPML
jgi:aminocarboxymuconate-semialdehyde decarboxylase